LDGVQRLNAIFSFIENNFPIDNKYFDVNEFARAKQLAEQDYFQIADKLELLLDKEQCANLLDYQLAVTIFPARTDEQVTEIFSRINSSGRQLSNQERRQAGIIEPFGELVRNISAEIRGDASKEILLLSEMPGISIAPTKSRQKYGLNLDDIFWVRQGILSRKNLRESEDEEMIADIVASILLNEPFPRSKERFDELYDKESDLYQKAETALLSYPTDKLYNEIKQIFSIIKEIVEEYDYGPNALRNIVSPQNKNPIKTAFYTIFMAFYDLLVKQNKSPVESKDLLRSLEKLQQRLTSGSHYATTEDRRNNINITIGLIQKHFVYEEPPTLGHGPSLAIDFENSIRRSRIETPRYEFKQGLLGLDDNRKFNEELINRIINTACGMANLGPNSEGHIFLGVADDKIDADRINELYGTGYIEIAEHYIVGIDREAKHLGWDIEKYVDKIITQIRNSELTNPLKTHILQHIDIINFKRYTIIRLRTVPQPKPSYVGQKIYARIGSQTREVVNAPEIAAIIGIFK